MTIRIPLFTKLSNQFECVDLLFSNGSIIENIAIDHSGLLLGTVAGGHDGLDESPFPFTLNDIVAYRRCASITARLGLSKWIYII